MLSLGKLKAKPVLDDAPGNVRDFPGGGGKEKESRKGEETCDNATRMTATPSII